MDARFVNCYLTAAQTVFKTMLNIQLDMGKPLLKKNNKSAGDITGVIGFAGDKRGSFAISLNKKSALTIYNALIGEEQEDINEDVVDAIGELTNIISGQTRLELEKIGFNLNAGLPTVLIGKDMEINVITKAPVITLPFSYSTNGTSNELTIDFSME